MRILIVLAVVATGNALIRPTAAQAVDDYDRAPIEYGTSTPENRVSRLQARLSAGESVLSYDKDRGYLSSLLDALEVPVESQLLVFSRTSMQVRRIRPRTPRAIYFNDDVYVGYCHLGDVLEISAADPKLGSVFYTLEQAESEQPVFRRSDDNCLACHSSSRTEDVPGHLVRSLLVDSDGKPIYSAGSHIVDHTTPLKDRWGGWYVTGLHGKQSHLGNLVFESRDVPDTIENDQGHNVEKLDDRLSVRKYLQPTSDIVALMLLEHQTLVHNRITKANFATRQALHYEVTMNEALGYPKGHALESTARRIQSAGDDLVEALLWVDEAPLTDPITGTSGYAEKFAKAGPFDREGRSLRDLDFTYRVSKYPCSYLVYSEAFEGLPPRMKDYVWERLWAVLSGQDDSDRFAHLSPTDRQAIAGILQDTVPGLPGYWNASSAGRVSLAEPHSLAEPQ